jgi:hypothetical protein
MDRYQPDRYDEHGQENPAKSNRPEPLMKVGGKPRNEPSR